MFMLIIHKLFTARTGSDMFRASAQALVRALRSLKHSLRASRHSTINSRMKLCPASPPARRRTSDCSKHEMAWSTSGSS